MKKIVFIIHSIIFFIFAIFSYKINVNNEKEFFIQGHYAPTKAFASPTSNMVKINIYTDDKIEIYSDKFRYTSYLKKYEKNVYTFKNIDENRINMIFFKNEKLYLLFNKFDDVNTFCKIYEAPRIENYNN